PSATCDRGCQHARASLASPARIVARRTKRKVRGGAWPPVAHLVHRAVVDRGPAGIRPPDPPSGAGASGTQARPPPDAPSAPARAAPAPDPARPQAPPPSL